jgi:hypothetical protein
LEGQVQSEREISCQPKLSFLYIRPHTNKRAGRYIRPQDQAEQKHEKENPSCIKDHILKYAGEGNIKKDQISGMVKNKEI